MEKISFDGNLKYNIAEANKYEPNEYEPMFYIALPILSTIIFVATKFTLTKMFSDKAYCSLLADTYTGIMAGTSADLYYMVKNKKHLKTANINLTHLSTKLISNGFYVKEENLKKSIITSETATKYIGNKTLYDTINDYHMLDAKGKLVVLREYRHTLEEKSRWRTKKQTNKELYALSDKELEGKNLPVEIVSKLVLK